MKESRIVSGALARREGHLLVKTQTTVTGIAMCIVGMAVHQPPAFGQATTFIAKLQMWESRHGNDDVVQAVKKSFLLSFSAAAGVADE